MKSIKYLIQCVAITFIFILLAETFVVGLAFALEFLGVGDGSISRLINR
tara:strand:- start:487 stop:633 length:147 start_codon:yes stop_codon:yes gene_type:complete